MQVRRSMALALSLFFFALQPAPATVCVNRFLARADGARLIVTLLTGKLTYQEAQDLARQHTAISLLGYSVLSAYSSPQHWLLHFPLHTAFRFSMNDASPSFASFVFINSSR